MGDAVTVRVKLVNMEKKQVRAIPLALPLAPTLAPTLTPTLTPALTLTLALTPTFTLTLTLTLTPGGPHGQGPQRRAHAEAQRRRRR